MRQTLITAECALPVPHECSLSTYRRARSRTLGKRQCAGAEYAADTSSRYAFMFDVKTVFVRSCRTGKRPDLQGHRRDLPNSCMDLADTAR